MTMDPIIIVGGGVVGTCLAYRLRDAPAEVVLLEKAEPGSGTTARSLASFAWHSTTDPAVHTLVRRSWDLYAPLVEDGTLDYSVNGALRTANTEEKIAALRADAGGFEDLGVRAEVLPSAALADHGLYPEAGREGGLYLPDVGQLQPQELVEFFLSAAQPEVDVRTGVEVTDVVVEDGRATGVETTDSHLDAGLVVNAAGPWAPALNDLAGVSVPLKHTFGPLVEFEAAEPMEIPTVGLESGHFFDWEPPGTVFAGHHPLIASELSVWDVATLEDPDADHDVGDEFRAEVGTAIEATFPALRDAEAVGETVGLRCVTPDGLPVVGETDLDGFWVMTGMSGKGYTMAPVCAATIADALRPGSPGVPAMLSPSRFDESA